MLLLFHVVASDGCTTRLSVRNNGHDGKDEEKEDEEEEWEEEEEEEESDKYSFRLLESELIGQAYCCEQKLSVHQKVWTRS